MHTPGEWWLNTVGIPIPLEPRGLARVAEAHQHYYGELTLVQRADPRWDLDNAVMCESFFRQRHLMELMR
jgi:hypothetical protein